jgi:molecular chaperone GrpE (heat shock protein)
LSAADAGERAKLLEQESHRLLAKLSEWQDKYLAAARRLESLRKELTRRQRHALAERRHYHRRAQKLRVPSDH